MSSRAGPSTGKVASRSKSIVTPDARRLVAAQDTFDSDRSENEDDIQDGNDDGGSVDHQSPDSDVDIEAVKPRRRAANEQSANGVPSTTGRRLP